MPVRSDIRAALSPRGAPREKIAAALRCLILLTVFLMARFDREGPPAAFDLVLGLGAAYVLATTFLPWARYDYRRATIAMLAADVILITALIYTHSGIRSEYYLLYYLPILHASVRLDFRDAVSTCLLAAASYLLVGLLEGPVAAITVTVVSRVSTFTLSAGLLAAFFICLSREQRAYQRLTEHYQKAMRSRNEFLSRVSHEFRTPLTAIVGFSQLLHDQEHELDPTRQHEYLSVIREQAQSLAHMIEDMLALSRIDDGRLVLHQEPVSLPEVFTSAVLLLPEPCPSHRLQVSADPAAPHAWADRKAIEQSIARILSHLLALSDHPVFARIAPGDDPAHQVRVSLESPALDTQHDTLSPLLRTPDPEPGDSTARSENLGLRLARALIELHGGRVSLQRGGKWPAVTFTLPACSPVGRPCAETPCPPPAGSPAPPAVGRVPVAPSPSR